MEKPVYKRFLAYAEGEHPASLVNKLLPIEMSIGTMQRTYLTGYWFRVEKIPARNHEMGVPGSPNPESIDEYLAWPALHRQSRSPPWLRWNGGNCGERSGAPAAGLPGESPAGGTKPGRLSHTPRASRSGNDPLELSIIVPGFFPSPWPDFCRQFDRAAHIAKSPVAPPFGASRACCLRPGPWWPGAEFFAGRPVFSSAASSWAAGRRPCRRPSPPSRLTGPGHKSKSR